MPAVTLPYFYRHGRSFIIEGLNALGLSWRSESNSVNLCPSPGLVRSATARIPARGFRIGGKL